MGMLLKASPDSHELQRMTLAAANNTTTGRIRTQQLKLLASVDDLDPDLRTVLLGDRNERVQAAVWARPDVPLEGVDVTALPMSVQLAVLSRPDIPAGAARAVAASTSSADMTRIVLDNRAMPADVTASVYRRLCEDFAAADFRKNDERHLLPLRRPDVGLLVATDAQAPIRARVYAAAHLEHQDTIAGVQSILATLETHNPQHPCLRLDLPEVRAWKAVRADGLFSISFRQWLTHADGLDAAARLATRWHELTGAAAASQAAGDLHRAAKHLRKPDQEVVTERLMSSLGLRGVHTLLESAPDDGALVKVASRIAVSERCSNEHFDVVAGHLRDASAAGLVKLRLKFQRRKPPGPGLARFPEVWIEELKSLPGGRSYAWLPYGEEYAGLYDAVAEAFIADPAAFAPEVGKHLVESGRLSGEQLIRFPTEVLLSAASSARSRPAVLSAFASAMEDLAQEDAGANTQIASALAGLLYGGGALDQLLEAIAAAYGT
jgi:hypothetical protein